MQAGGSPEAGKGQEMQRIIIPLDGSELDEQAVGLGERMAEAFGGTIDLVHVLTATPVLAANVPDPVSIDGRLAGFATSLSPRFSVRTSVLEGDPAEELLALSARAPGTMVVMATHGWGGLRRVAFGSVADQIMRDGSAPVAVVRGPARTQIRAPRRLLVALDGSELAERSLPPAMQLARTYDAGIHLVRVVNASFSPYLGPSFELSPAEPALLAELADQMHEDARAYLDEVATSLRRQGIRVSWEVRAGTPGEEIVRAAETSAADLILMCTHGRGGVRRWVLGSVTDTVLRTGSIPLLVIPSRGMDFAN